MKYVRKSAHAFVAFLLVTFSVHHCVDISVNISDPDQQAVNDDATALKITFNGSDNLNSVTTHLILPTTGASGTTIVWSSDNSGVINIDGTVNRPAFGSGNATVALTATVKKGAYQKTVTYTVIVMETPPTDAEAVAADKANLNPGFSGSDTAAGVTWNLSLPAAGASGTTITWASDTPSVIAANGVVSRPLFGSGNATVTLTATITKNAANDTKVFVLTVIETPPTDAEATAADKAALSILYGGSDSAGNVTLDVGLSASGSNGTIITWASDTPAVITNAGVVSRPLFGSGNATVTLTATITKNAANDTKVFVLTVIETPPTDAEAVAADKAALVIVYGGPDSATSVTQNVGLSASGLNGTTITWASDTPAVITNAGVVSRPFFGSGNATVTLTATIQKNGTNDVKVFVLTVIETPGGCILGTSVLDIDCIL